MTTSPFLTAFHRRVHGIFLAIEYARRPAMIGLFVPGKFQNAAFGGKVPFEDHQTAGVFDRIGKRAHDVLSRTLLCAEGFFVQRFEARGHSAAMQQASIRADASRA